MKKTLPILLAAASLMLLPTVKAQTATPHASPLEVAAAYKTALSTLHFEALRTMMTSQGFNKEFRDEERECERAKETQNAHDIAEWEEELREAKEEAADMQILEEQIFGDRAVVAYREVEDNELSFILFKRANESSRWRIHDPDEDDRPDVERFLKTPLTIPSNNTNTNNP